MAVAAVLLFCTTPSNAVADVFEQYGNAKNAFDAGEYEEAVRRFEELLDTHIQNPALVLEAYKLLGISYLFLGNLEAAESNFTKLLTRAPDFELDPLLYPIEVIDVFASIKQRNEKRLEALAKARELERKRKAAEAARRRQEEMERLTRNVYIERTREERSLFVALMPLGAGQFQNGHRTKAWLFLSGELLLGATSTVFFFLHSSLRPPSETPIPDDDERASYQNKERVFRLTNHISLGVLGSVVIWGIADSLYHFRRTRVTWKHVDEKEVPEKLRPHSDRHGKRSTSFSFQFGTSFVGAGLSGRF